MTPSHRPSRTRAILFGRVPVLSLLLAVALPAFGQDLARGKATLASSLESTALVSGNAVDGNAGTRWASAFSDPQWIQVDLGSVQTLSRVVLNWEGASARDYQVQVSNDGTSWTPIATRSNMAAGARRDDITSLSGSGRYVRMYGTARTSQWGYSLFDFEVYGGTGPSLPGRIQAEDYKAGGPGVGFHDVTPANEGGAYRTDAVDIEFTGDVGGGFNVGWTVAGEWLAYDVTVPEAGVFDFTARVASNVAGTKTLRLDVDGAQVGTFDLTTAAGWHTYSDLVLNGVGLTAGNHTLRLTMVTGSINFNWFEAALASNGNGTLAFSSATYSVAENGGALTVNVNRTGGSAGTVGVTYATSNGTASAGSDYTAQSGTLSFAPGVTSQSFTVPILDDQAVESAETFTLALSAPTGGATLGSPATATATITDNDATRPSLPGRLQAEDYKAGGPGVGFHDMTATNEGGAYRTDAVDIEATSDVGGGFNVGWTQAGEWLAYDVTVPEAGVFDFTARVASDVAGTKSIRYEVDGAPVGTVNFTLASGWQIWGDATLRGIALSAGDHTLKIHMATGNFNLNHLDVVRQGRNQAPIAAAGWDETAIAGRVFTLDGRATRDPDNGPSALTHAWTQVGGPAVALTGAATARPSFTPTEAGVYTFRLAAGDGAATATDEVVLTVLADPAQSGPHTSTRVVYAAPGLDYGYLAQPPIIISGYTLQGDYLDYHLLPATSPYATRTVNMSVFNTGGNTMFPPIASDASNIPVNGVFYLPSGNGPFPVAFFVHGNHHPLERSEPGYEEAAAHLASQGVLAVSVDMNYMNASGGNGGRAILLLEHLKQFRTWNSTPGHPLQGKVDMNRILIIGHSRGGEAVQHASFFNRLTREGRTVIRPYPNTADYAGYNDPVAVDGSGQLGPYAFNLSAVVSISPTESQYMPVDPADETRRIASTVHDAFFLIYGSRDSDVYSFDGYQAYDRAVPFPHTTVADDAGAVKALLYLHNANHNFFNRVWSATPDGSGRCRYGICYNSILQLHKDDQYAALKVWLSTVTQAMVLGRPGYLDVLRHKPLMASALPRPWRNVRGETLELDFNSQYQDRWRRLLNHFEEDVDMTTASPLPAGISGTNEVLGNMTAAELPLTWAQNSRWFLQDTRGLNIVWSGAGTNSYRTNFSNSLPLASSQGQAFTHLALRVGFTATETANPAGVDQDLTLEARDFSGRTFSLSGADLFGGTSVMPYQHFFSSYEAVYAPYTMVMQTLRFPLQAFAQRGVAVDDIAEIRLRFDRTPAGSLYIDDIQLTR